MVKKSTDLVRVAQGVEMPRWQAEQYGMSYVERLALVPESGAKRHASSKEKHMVVAGIIGGFVGGVLVTVTAAAIWVAKNVRPWGG